MCWLFFFLIFVCNSPNLGFFLHCWISVFLVYYLLKRWCQIHTKLLTEMVLMGWSDCVILVSRSGRRSSLIPILELVTILFFFFFSFFKMSIVLVFVIRVCHFSPILRVLIFHFLWGFSLCPVILRVSWIPCSGC